MSIMQPIRNIATVLVTVFAVFAISGNALADGGE